MSYKITVLKSEVTKAPKGYSVAEIAYKTADGNTKGMKVLDFVQKDVFAVVKEAKPGDILDAEFEKNPKGFWVLKSLIATGHKEDTSSVQTATPSTPAKGNWETSEERAAKQIMIVRQSSLSNAIATFTGNESEFASQDVIELAKVYEAYVLSQPTGEIA